MQSTVLTHDGSDSGDEADEIDAVPVAVPLNIAASDLEDVPSVGTAAAEAGSADAAGEHFPSAATCYDNVADEERSQVVEDGSTDRDDEPGQGPAARALPTSAEPERFAHVADIQPPTTEPTNLGSATYRESKADPAAEIEYPNVVSNASTDTASTNSAALGGAEERLSDAADTRDEAVAIDRADYRDERRADGSYGSGDAVHSRGPCEPEKAAEEIRVANPVPGERTNALILAPDAPAHGKAPADAVVCLDSGETILDAETGPEIADASTRKPESPTPGWTTPADDVSSPMTKPAALESRVGRDTERSSPPTYRPRLDRSRPKRQSVPPKAAAEREYQDLEADLQILFGTADWGIEMSALLRLPVGAEEVAVLEGGDEIWLGALDDRFLEPLVLTDGGRVLSEGLSITAVGLPVRWRRSSRDIHVFRAHGSVAGFVSQPRVAIGQENVVICRDELADTALAQIAAIGTDTPIRIEGPGVPAGWTCWRGIRPARPSFPGDGLAILHALDPLPAVSIELVGGLQLSRGRWLEGHPPSIRLLGLVEPGEAVRIDGHPASLGDDGAWTADGWDRQGTHRIEHGGISAAYEIEPGASSWDWWPAWSKATAVAGALASAHGTEYFHTGPFAHLLGPAPGEICGFSAANGDIYAARPEFAPVWLLARGAGMRRAIPYLIGTPLPPLVSASAAAPAVTRWARAICSIGRTGASGSVERRLWDQYLAAAKRKQR